MSSWRDRNSSDVSYSHLRHNRREPDSKTPSITKDKSVVFTNMLSIAGGVISVASIVILSFSWGLSTNNRNTSNVNMAAGSANVVVNSARDRNNDAASNVPTTSTKTLVFSCQVDDSGTYNLVGTVGSAARLMMRVREGMEYFGSGYSPSQRCQTIASRMNDSISKGATGLKATILNGYPIVCAAKVNKGSSECMYGDDGEIIIIATFKRGASIGGFAEFFNNFVSGAVSSKGVIKTYSDYANFSD
jgi:hypothetical protein